MNIYSKAIITLICVLWPSMMAVSAFASHHTTSSTTVLPSTMRKSIVLPTSRASTSSSARIISNASSSAYRTPANNRSNLHKQHRTQLHLTIPRGGGAVAQATSSLSSYVSTPTGTFNTALILLGAATAFLKLYNKVDANNSSKDEENKQLEKKDPKVKALQLRFLMVFWLLRMADWLQVSLHYLLVLAS